MKAGQEKGLLWTAQEQYFILEIQVLYLSGDSLVVHLGWIKLSDIAHDKIAFVLST